MNLNWQRTCLACARFWVRSPLSPRKLSKQRTLKGQREGLGGCGMQNTSPCLFQAPPCLSTRRSNAWLTSNLSCRAGKQPAPWGSSCGNPLHTMTKCAASCPLEQQVQTVNDNWISESGWFTWGYGSSSPELFKFFPHRLLFPKEFLCDPENIKSQTSQVFADTKQGILLQNNSLEDTQF